MALSHDGYAGVSRVLTLAVGRTERLLVSLVPAGAEVRRPGAPSYWERPDGIGFEGDVFDHAALESGTYDLWLNARPSTAQSEQLLRQVRQDPSWGQRD